MSRCSHLQLSPCLSCLPPRVPSRLLGSRLAMEQDEELLFLFNGRRRVFRSSCAEWLVPGSGEQTRVRHGLSSGLGFPFWPPLAFPSRFGRCLCKPVFFSRVQYALCHSQVREERGSRVPERAVDRESAMERLKSLVIPTREKVPDFSNH